MLLYLLLFEGTVDSCLVRDRRHLHWEGFFNTRDLGGLPTRDRRTTRFGAFIRSADLRFVTAAGWQAARMAGVRTVIDLRNEDEIRPGSSESPTRRAGSAQFPATATDIGTPPGISRVEVPLDDVDDIEFWRHVNQEGLNGSPLYYRPFLERKAHRCATVVTALARTGPGGVLFHCGAGRDRAGLVALLQVCRVAEVGSARVVKRSLPAKAPATDKDGECEQE